MDQGVFLKDPHTKHRAYAKSMGDKVDSLEQAQALPGRQTQKEGMEARLDTYKDLNYLHKAVIMGRFFYGESFSELASNLKMSTSTVYGVYCEGVEIMKRSGRGT